MTTEQAPTSPPVSSQEAKPNGHLLPWMLTQRQEADALWNEAQPLVRHGKSEDVLFSHLLNAGATVEQLNDVFDGQGRIKTREKLEFDYAKVSPGELFNRLVHRFWPVYQLINPSIDHAYEAGFTGHGGMDHIIPVTRNTWELLKKAGASVDEQKCGISASAVHDGGMVGSRPLHPFLSSRFAMWIVPELAQDLKVALQIRKAIILHDEKVAGKYMDILATKYGVDTDEFYDALLKKFGRPALALIIADKADAINRRRATQKKGVDGETLIGDPQTLITVLGDSRGYETIEIPETEGRQKHIRTLSFLPYLSEEEEGLEAYKVASERHKNKVGVPPLYRELHRDYGVPHFFSWQADNWTFNAKRLGLEARALFALFPELNTYELKIVDDSALSTGFIMSFSYVIDHADVKEFIQHLSDEMAFPKNNRTPGALPAVFRAEANLMRKQNIESLMEVTSVMRHELWRSKSGESKIVADYKFIHPHQPDSVAHHVEKLFSPKEWREV